MNTKKTSQLQSILSIVFLPSLAIFGFWLITHYEVLPYFYFLRVPLIVGLLLVFLPLISIKLAPKILQNLFILRNNGQLLLVLVGSTLAGLATVIIANTIFTNAHLRFCVPELQTIMGVTEEQIGSKRLQDLIAFIISLPISLTAIFLSKNEIESNNQTNKISIWWGILSGWGLSIILLIAVYFVRYYLESSKSLEQILLKLFSILPEKLQQGYILSSGKLAPGIVEGIALLLVILTINYFVYHLGKPKAESGQFEAPALLYVTLILAGAVQLLGEMSFLLDYFGIPVIIVFLTISAVGYLIFEVDHFYDLKDYKGSKPDPSDWKKSLYQRLDKYQHEYKNEDKILVVVCASGGGIQAAGWTTAVLTGLQEVIGISFTQAIGWISSVSGGSVGTMYYLDRFSQNSEDGYPKQGELKHIFNSATADSLDAIGWGLAYPDLLRFIGLPFLVPKMQDRGSAVEINWRGELKDPKAPPSLTDWREKVEAGIIPIPIFNATIVEDGRRFLISPMTFRGYQYKSREPKSKDLESRYKFIDFNTLYPEYDIDVTTAARLSATFPYVSPISRPNLSYKFPADSSKRETESIFHVADGGYFDNFGVATSVQLLNQLLAYPGEDKYKIKKVLFLQINAFADSPITNNNLGEPGWLIAVIGSIKAVLKVRSSTQTASDSLAVKFLKDKWKKKDVEIADFTISFPKEIDKQPLSWQLTQEQKKAIKTGWKELKESKSEDAVVKAIKQKWQEWQRQLPPNLE